jgi:hypothetical protein
MLNKYLLEDFYPETFFPLYCHSCLGADDVKMPYAEGSTIFFKFFQDVVHLEDAQHLKALWSQAPVAHTCNPSYSGGRDQEDRVSQPA